MSKTTFEINKLAKGHPHGVEHECFEYESWYHYLDSKSNYHFDKYKDDSNHPDINTDLKFRWKNNIMDEVLPFVREKSRNVHPNSIDTLFMAWWFHKNEIRGLDHNSFKESVKKDKHPTIQKIVDWYEFEDEIQAIVMMSLPGMFDTWHVDTHDGHPSGYGLGKEVHRVIIQLVDWEPGMFVQWGNMVIPQWRAGDTVSWKKDMPHTVANSSRYTRYALRITGIPSANTLDKIKKGGIVTI